MTAPNIVGVTTIKGQTALANTTSTSANVIIANTDTVVKVNSVIIPNYSTANFTANVGILRAGHIYLHIGNVTIPANSTMVVSGKDTSFYLEEGDCLRVSTSNNSSVIASYEIIS